MKKRIARKTTVPQMITPPPFGVPSFLLCKAEYTGASSEVLICFPKPIFPKNLSQIGVKIRAPINPAVASRIILIACSKIICKPSEKFLGLAEPVGAAKYNNTYCSLSIQENGN